MSTLYGLPEEVKFCTRCVQSNQRPCSAVEFRHTINSKKTTLHLDEEGVCDACRVAEQKANTDWNQRDKELRELCDRYRRTDGRYDCIVPGSGGKDSFVQSWKLKYDYGMHPLTITWSPNVYTPWGRANHDAWIASGMDNILVTPNSRVHRLLTRLAVDNLFHPFHAFMCGQKWLAPKLAEIYDIPFIAFGENESEHGNPIADTKTSLRDKSYYALDNYNDVCLSGVPVRELKERYGLSDNDLAQYMPLKVKPSTPDIAVHYLGYYMPFRPQSNFYFAVEHGGFQPGPERTPGSYQKFNSQDDAIDDLHYWTTYVKFGIGRATYDASADIRNGEIDRDEGKSLVARYDGEFPERFMPQLMRHLSVEQKQMPVAYEQFENPAMTRELFIDMADRFRSPHLWTKDSGQWKLRKTVWQ